MREQAYRTIRPVAPRCFRLSTASATGSMKRNSKGDPRRRWPRRWIASNPNCVPAATWSRTFFTSCRSDGGGVCSRRSCNHSRSSIRSASPCRPTWRNIANRSWRHPAAQWATEIYRRPPRRVRRSPPIGQLICSRQIRTVGCGHALTILVLVGYRRQPLCREQESRLRVALVAAAAVTWCRPAVKTCSRHSTARSPSVPMGKPSR